MYNVLCSKNVFFFKFIYALSISSQKNRHETIKGCRETLRGECATNFPFEPKFTEYWITSCIIKYCIADIIDQNFNKVTFIYDTLSTTMVNLTEFLGHNSKQMFWSFSRTLAGTGNLEQRKWSFLKTIWCLFLRKWKSNRFVRICIYFCIELFDINLDTNGKSNRLAVVSLVNTKTVYTCDGFFLLSFLHATFVSYLSVRA